MKKGSAVPWILLYGACLFALGFFTHMLLADRTVPPEAGYLDRLTEALSLTPEQQEGVRRLLEEADRRIDALKDGEEARALLARIRKIRAETSEAIRGLLDDNQRRRYDGLEPPAGEEGGGGGGR